MSIILNEREYAEAVINSRHLGKKPTEALSRVARYYAQVDGYSRSDTKAKLESLLIQCDPDAVVVNWTNTLDRMAKRARRFPLIEIDGVPITEAELTAIESVPGSQQQRLAFTLLCLSKYWNLVNGSNNNWVNTDDQEIMQLANIKTSTQRQGLMIHNLRNLGLIKFSRRVDSLNTQVLFLDEQSPAALYITDFRSLGHQYLMHCGDDYIQCAQCGLAIKRKGNAHKFCPSCIADKATARPEAPKFGSPILS